ncbi:MAG: hypothetical protein ACXABY_10035 [Candidatus Thorarchaeota archaeon]|jgi:hypothetical protein
MIQLGDTNGYDTSGYLSHAVYEVANTMQGVNYTDGAYGIQVAPALASSLWVGHMRFCRWDAAEHIWIYTGGIIDTALTTWGTGSGEHTLTDPLTSVRLNTNGGTANFDAGEARVRYKN